MNKMFNNFKQISNSVITRFFVKKIVSATRKSVKLFCKLKGLRQIDNRVTRLIKKIKIGKCNSIFFMIGSLPIEYSKWESVLRTLYKSNLL